jgi:tRNA uridine 5-carboxymethylaminomethyl modification enzyme
MVELEGWRSRLRSLTVTPSAASRAGVALNADGVRRTAFELLSYPGIDLRTLSRIWPDVGGIEPPLGERLVTDARYAVYLDRQREDIASFEREEGRRLPEGLSFDAMPGLSNELRQKLSQIRPQTLGQASRIEGMTPAGLAILALNSRAVEAAARAPAE